MDVHAERVASTMNTMPLESPLRIRQATTLDLAVLPDIERAAAAQFRFTAHPSMADAVLASEHVGLSHENIWVAVDAQDQPVAFAIVIPAWHSTRR